MPVLRKTPWLLVFFIIVGGLLGGILSGILESLSPEGPLSEIFLYSFHPGIDPPFTLDLHLFKLTFGLSVRLTILSLLGMVLGVYIYKQA